MSRDNLRRDLSGWSPSPVFDVNPNSVIGVERKTSVNFTALPGEARDALFAITPYFDLNSDEAQGIWDCVIDGVFSWRAVAKASRCARA